MDQENDNSPQRNSFKKPTLAYMEVNSTLNIPNLYLITFCYLTKTRDMNYPEYAH